MSRRNRDQGEQFVAHDRRVTDARFHEIDAISRAKDHRDRRENKLREKARKLAAENLSLQIAQIAEQTARNRDVVPSLMTRDAFEREHRLLIASLDSDLKVLRDKIGGEERVTLRQDTTESVLANVRATNRWMIGIAVGTFSTFAVLAAHLVGLIK